MKPWNFICAAVEFSKWHAEFCQNLPQKTVGPRDQCKWTFENCWFYGLFLQIGRMVVRHFQEQQQKEVKAEKEDALKLKRIASNLAKCVKEFWTNIEKVKILAILLFLLLDHITVLL